MDPLRWRYRAGRLTRAGSGPVLLALVWLLSVLVWSVGELCRTRVGRWSGTLVLFALVLVLLLKGTR